MEKRNEKKKKVIFFDMDGTIIDSKKHFFRWFGKVLESNGISFSKKDLKKELNGQKAEDVFIKVIGKSNSRKKEKVVEEPADLAAKMPSKKIKELVKELRALERKEYKKVKIIPCFKKAFEFASRNFKVFLLTHSDKKFTEAVIKKYNLKFEKMFCGDAFPSKEKVIKSIKKKYGLSDKDVLYVGDTVKDVDVARKAGCLVAIIPNWSPKYLVKKAKPDYLLNSICELKDILKRF